MACYSNKEVFNSATIGLATTNISVLLLGQGGFSSHPATLISILFFAAILDKLQIPLDQKVIVRFGELTYSAFLRHVPIQLLIILVLEKTSATTEISKFEAFFVFYLITVYVTANLSFVYVECPAKISLLRHFLVVKIEVYKNALKT